MNPPAELNRLPFGELLMAGFDGTSPSAKIVELIRHHHLGGVILYGKNCIDAFQVLELTNALQREARKAGAGAPLFIAIDQEQGPVSRLKEGVSLFPSMAELARLEDPHLLRRVSAAVSRELRAVGINWNLAPVADVVSVSPSPLADRSFGRDAATVAQLVRAFVEGAEEASIISCLKHFPGHGGTGGDSHVDLPTVELPKEVMEGFDLRPFVAGIAAGAPTVMTAHVTYPAFDSSSPATFSTDVLQGLLRERLSFPGVIVSDDLEMAGSVGTYPLFDAAVEALLAGIDVILVSGMLLPERDLPGLVDNLPRALGERSGDAGGLTSSLERVRALKSRYLGSEWSKSAAAAKEELVKAENRALVAEVHERLVRLERLDGGSNAQP